MTRRVGRRLVAAAFAGGLVAAGAALTSTASPALATQDAKAQSAEVRAQKLPAPLKQAIERDLKKSPTQYVKEADAAAKASSTARELRAQLGPKVGGAWLDGNALNVAVTDEAAGRAVQAAGGTPHLRPVSEEGLAASQDAVGKWVLGLSEAERKLFHAVSADVRQGKVVVRINDSDAGRQLGAKVPAAGPAPVVVEYAKGDAPIVHVRGGEGLAMGTGGDPGTVLGLCSLGFNAVNADGLGRPLTAGHCALGGTNFVFTEDGLTPVGQIEDDVFDDINSGGEGDDYATIAVTNPAVELTPDVNNHDGAAVEVHNAVAPLSGMDICKSGRTTGWTCGKVEQTRVEVTSTPPSGPARLISVLQHNACSRPGDSGGSVIAGNSAVGLTQGGVPGPTPEQCPSDVGEPNFSVSEILVDDVLGDFTGGKKLTLLTTTGDADGDGVKDIDELSDNPTQKRDANGDGLAAFLDPDEPNLRAPAIVEPANEGRTTDTTPAISGTGKAGAEVTLSIDGGEPQTADVGQDGKWTVQADELELGAHEISAKLTFGATESGEATSTFSVVPQAPVITSPGDGTVADERRPEIKGTGIAGATVHVAINDAEAGSATVDEAGNWSVTLAADLPFGKHTIKAAQTVSEVTSDAAQVTYEVRNPNPAPGPGPGDDDDDGLAETGSNAIVPLTIIGALALLAGAGTVLLARRRSARRSMA
jgi:streptogrisin C